MKTRTIIFLLISAIILIVVNNTENKLETIDSIKTLFLGLLSMVSSFYIVRVLKQKYGKNKIYSKEEEIFINNNKEDSVLSHFYGSNTTIIIQGIKILDALIYVSSEETPLDFSTEVPFLVVPKLPIAKRNYNYQENKGRTLQSYSGMSQKEKLEYLLWIKNKCSGELYNKDFILIYVEGLRYRFFNVKEDQEDCLLRVISIFNEYKNTDRKIKQFLEESVLYMLIQIDYFESLKELTTFIKKDLLLDKTDNLRYRLILDFLIYNSYPVDFFYVLYTYSAVYKDIAKFINSTNRKLLLELFKEEFPNNDKNFSIKEEVLKFKNYSINRIKYVFEPNFEEKLNKFVEKTINEIKVFLIATKGKSYEESFHFLPDKYKKKFRNPLFNLIMKNTKEENGIYSVGDLIENVPYFNPENDKLNSKESKFLTQLIVDGQWSIEPDFRIQNKSYKNETKVYIYKQNSKEVGDSHQEIKNQVILDTIYSLVNIKLTNVKKKVILDFIQNKVIKDKSEMERMKKRIQLLMVGETPLLTNMSKVKFKVEDVKNLKEFFDKYQNEFLFNEAKKKKFLELIS